MHPMLPTSTVLLRVQASYPPAFMRLGQERWASSVDQDMPSQRSAIARASRSMFVSKPGGAGSRTES